LVSAAKNLPISSKILTDTKIGRGINSIVKDGVFEKDEISKTALNLVNDWKLMVKNSKKPEKTPTSIDAKK
jgi:hypothetical protein